MPLNFEMVPLDSEYLPLGLPLAPEQLPVRLPLDSKKLPLGLPLNSGRLEPYLKRFGSCFDMSGQRRYFG